jgi:hypothetical protein
MSECPLGVQDVENMSPSVATAGNASIDDGCFLYKDTAVLPGRYTRSRIHSPKKEKHSVWVRHTIFVIHTLKRCSKYGLNSGVAEYWLHQKHCDQAIASEVG